MNREKGWKIKMAKVTKTMNEKGQITNETATPPDRSAFDALEGEHFAGPNVLKLEPGEFVRDVVITDIKKGQDHIGKKKFKKGVLKDIYSGRIGKRNVSLPIGKAFEMKAADAKLEVGDTIAILRGADYPTKDGGVGKGYEIKVQARVKS